VIDHDAVDLIGHVLEGVGYAFQVPKDFARHRELQRLLPRLLKGALQSGRVNVVGIAFEPDEPFRQLVKPSSVPAYIAQQRDSLIGRPRRFHDDRNDVLHLGAKLLDFVEVDRTGGGQHFIDGVIHRSDQRCDCTTVERREESLANGRQDVADDIVRDMFAVLDGLESLLGRAAAIGELLQSLRRRDQHR